MERLIPEPQSMGTHEGLYPGGHRRDVCDAGMAKHHNECCAAWVPSDGRLDFSGQPSRQGIALFSVLIEVWRSTGESSGVGRIGLQEPNSTAEFRQPVLGS